MKFLCRSQNKRRVTALKIALLGAPGTGKSQLSTALNLALRASGWPAAIFTAEASLLDRPDLTLLMGLEAPRDDALAADQSIRVALAQAGNAYEVLYGPAGDRLARALALIEKRLLEKNQGDVPTPSDHQAADETARNADQKPESDSNKSAYYSANYPSYSAVWACAKCSDPQCEHRLLTDLLARRFTAP